MKVHFFTKGDEAVPSSRLRAFLVARELNKRGIDSVIHWPPVELISRTRWPAKLKLISKALKNLVSVKRGDVIFIQRAIYNKYFVISAVLYKVLWRRKLIFDFDDAIYLHSPLKTKVFTKIADVVFVGSHALAEWSKKHNNKVYLIPTSINLEDYKDHQKDFSNPSDKFIIGWVGNGPAHYDNLKILREVLVGLSRSKIRYKFMLIGSLNSQKVIDLFKNIPDIDAEFIDKVAPDLVPEVIKKFDVGVMPLDNSDWNAGKCALKAIEYMACGVPTIVSSVGENSYLIKDGMNGFTATKPIEWVEKISLLKKDNDLAKNIGLAGKKTIEENYTFDINIPKIVSALKNICRQ